MLMDWEDVPSTPGSRVTDSGALIEIDIEASVTPKTGVPKISCPPIRVMKISTIFVTVFLSPPTVTPFIFSRMNPKKWHNALIFYYNTKNVHTGIIIGVFHNHF